MPMTLEALERVIHQVMRDETSIAAGAKTLQVDARRLGVYRGFVRGHIRSALESNFGLLEAWVGPTTWHALVRGYRAAYPPSHWGLGQAGDRFPAFVAERVEAGALGLTPVHTALAELEWALFEAQIDQARMPEQRSAPVLNPTLSVLTFAYPIVALAVALNTGTAPEPPEPGEQLVLVYRQPTREVAAYHVADAELLFAVKMVHEGLSVADAAQVAQQPVELVEAVLAKAVRAGVVPDAT